MSPPDTPPWKAVPDDLAAPDDVLSTLRETTRSDYILAHGFTEADLAASWWRQRNRDIGFPTRLVGEEPRLTRSDLFTMGRQASSDNDLLTFVWHVLAWGSGKSRRNNTARIENCTIHVGTLRDAVKAAQDGDPRAAYSLLVQPGRATIPRLGPAFFTKILYFASEGVPNRCLILDARVAHSLYNLGWAMAPTYRAGTRNFSYNWYTDTYVSYCSLLHAWATKGISADMLERALFQGGRTWPALAGHPTVPDAP